MLRPTQESDFYLTYHEGRQRKQLWMISRTRSGSKPDPAWLPAESRKNAIYQRTVSPAAC